MDWGIIQDIVTLPFFGKLVYILVVLFLTFVFGFVVDILMRKSYKHSLELQARFRRQSKAKHVIEKTKFNLLRRFITALIYIGGLLMIIAVFPSLRELSYSLLAGAGVIAIIIGFATQEVFANIVAGVFISLFEPFRIDDRIDIGTDKGYVEDLTLWHTAIRTFDNQRLIIPNSIMAKEKIVNYSMTDLKTLNMIDFGISYDSDFKLAKKIIAEEVEKNPRMLDNREEHNLLAKEDPYKIRMVSHGDFSIGIRLYAWTATPSDGFLLKCELLESVKERFDKEGVEIPFPYMTIVEKRRLPKNKKLKKSSPTKKKQAKKTVVAEKPANKISKKSTARKPIKKTPRKKT